MVSFYHFVHTFYHFIQIGFKYVSAHWANEKPLGSDVLFESKVTSHKIMPQYNHTLMYNINSDIFLSNYFCQVSYQCFQYFNKEVLNLALQNQYFSLQKSRPCPGNKYRNKYFIFHKHVRWHSIFSTMCYMTHPLTAGRYGKNCQYKCPRFSYGPGCTERCKCSKRYSRGCNKVTGHCICHSGFQGEKCTEPCNTGKSYT